jgi:hypothetical protein
MVHEQGGVRMTRDGRTTPVGPGEPTPDFTLLPSDDEILEAARAL